MKESDLIEGIKTSDKNIIKQMMNQMWPKIRAYVLKYSGTEADARDVFQEALVDFIDYVKTGKYAKGDWEACLMRFCTNKWRKLWRDHKSKYRRLEFISENFSEASEWQDESWELFQRLPEMVQEKISELEENCREALKLRYFEAWSEKSMAEHLQISYGYMRQLLYRCRNRLKKIIEADKRFEEFR